jgi:hypothetical protein
MNDAPRIPELTAQWSVELLRGSPRHQGRCRESDPKGGSRFFWTADLLPDELAPQVDQMMTEGIEAVKRTLEASAQAA